MASKEVLMKSSFFEELFKADIPPFVDGEYVLYAYLFTTLPFLPSYLSSYLHVLPFRFLQYNCYIRYMIDRDPTHFGKVLYTLREGKLRESDFKLDKVFENKYKSFRISKFLLLLPGRDCC